MKQKKQGFLTFLLVLIFLIGLGVLLYPTISDYWNSHTQSQAIENYEVLLSGLSDEEYETYWEQADAYNAQLRMLSFPFTGYSELEDDYQASLNVDGNGIMGFITIVKIDVQLPIYHGTSSLVLNHAVGHLEGSSLPVGGESTHCVLSAHRGLPSARLFTDLDRMEVGDTFQITTLNQVLTYEVYNIEIVLPQDVDSLQVKSGEDLCTLVTCTPYGVNTHRLLVHAKRIETEAEDAPLYISADAYKVDPMITAPMIAVPLLILLLIFVMVKYRRRK